jgi:hypothetical protein
MAGLLHRFGVLNLQTGKGEIDRVEEIFFCEVSMPEMKDNVATQPVRRRLPDERKAIVHHFNVGGYEGYLTVGFYEDGTVGEIFITTAKEATAWDLLVDACTKRHIWVIPEYHLHARSACAPFRAAS